MLTPKECLVEFKSEEYLINNIAFISPVYQELFKNLGTLIKYTQKYETAVECFKKYIKILYNLKGNNELLIDKIKDDDINNAIINLKIILNEIINKRTNINGIEAFCWIILNVTALDELKRIDGEYLYTRVVSMQLIKIIQNIDFHFFAIMLNNLLNPYELKSPTRRKGIFDKRVFKLISSKLKLSNNYSRNDNWLIDETKVKKIKAFMMPSGVKYPDMICRIGDKLFIGAHKEQNVSGGGQDNQAEDARRIYLLDKEKYKEQIKNIFIGVKQIFFVIIYDTHNKIGTGEHWMAVYNDVQKFQNRYITNSIIFKELLESC